jgi:preprotein translocase subunit YajC
MNKLQSPFTVLAASLAAFATQPAVAQSITSPPATSAPAPGMMVKDTAGAMVGTVIKVGDGLVTVKTDKHVAVLPVSSFTPHEGALLFAMTQAELNADVEKHDEEVAAMFKEGAAVRGTGGVDAGTIIALNADTVTLKLASGTLVRVPRSGIAAGADGLVVGMTAQQLEAAAGPSDKK